MPILLEADGFAVSFVRVRSSRGSLKIKSDDLEHLVLVMEHVESDCRLYYFITPSEVLELITVLHDNIRYDA